MKVYILTSTHIDTITPKLLEFDWNSLEFKPRGVGPDHEILIDPKILGIPATQPSEEFPIFLSHIEIWLWDKDKYNNNRRANSPGEYIKGSRQCSIRLNLVKDSDTKISEVVGLLLHELKHYYDDHYDRKLHDLNYSPEGTVANYFMHNVEFLPQAYSLAMSTLSMSSMELFGYLKKATLTPDLDFKEVASLPVPKVLRTSMLSIYYYLFGEHYLYRKGDTVKIPIEEKVKRVGVFLRVIARVRNKLSKYLQDFNDVLFKPNLLSWKEYNQKKS